jgi:hypothetical protein
MVGCSDDKTESKSIHLGAEVVETDMPENIGWQGGKYTIEMDYNELTRAMPKQVFEPWCYRVSVGGSVIEEEEITDGAESVTIYIQENLTESERAVKVEILSPEALEQTPVWKEVANAVQQPGLIEVGGIYWTQGNLTVHDGQFAITKKPEDSGFFFKHRSTYGISSEGANYQGKAYNPEEVTITLEDIPEKNGDPCKMISGADLRIPTLYEMELLSYEFSDYSDVNGITGMLFSDKFFLPFAGACDLLGAIGYKNTNGGYWHSGEDVDGLGGLLMGSKEYLGSGPFVSNNLVSSLTTIRCVRNTRIPIYVSHTPSEAENSAAFTVTVLTDPGDFEEYPVSLFDGAYEVYAMATKDNPEAVIQVPENDMTDDIVYELFVNGERTGKKILQPGMKDYVRYMSHTPTGKVPSDAFTLTVKYESDLDSFDVEVKSGAESIATGTGSKDNLNVQLLIPENDGKDRVLEIYVNGEKTRGTVTQEENPNKNLFSVIWSSGYLTIKDGAYTFAGEQERGLFFKFKSKYGMTLNAGGTAYSGTAYSPSAETLTYAEVTYGDVDPCSLIADGYSWRLPTQEEFQNLLSFEYTWLKDSYRAYTDGQQTVYIVPSGSLNATGAKVDQPAWARAWTSTPKDDTKYITLSGTFSGQATTFIVTAGAAQNIAMMVRCVRTK